MMRDNRHDVVSPNDASCAPCRKCIIQSVEVGVEAKSRNCLGLDTGSAVECALYSCVSRTT